MINVLAKSPVNADTQVETNPEIVYVVRSTFTITSVILYNGFDKVYEYNGVNTLFTRPDYFGTPLFDSLNHAVSFKRRRDFIAGQNVKIFATTVNSGAETLSDSWYFTIRDGIRPAVDTRLNSTLNVPFTNLPALETHRQIIREYTSTAPESLLNVCWAIVKYSDLYAVILPYLPTDWKQRLTVWAEPPIPNPTTLLPLISDSTFLWDSTLTELLSLGAHTDTTNILNTWYNSNYPHEKMITVCAALLIAAGLVASP